MGGGGRGGGGRLLYAEACHGLVEETEAMAWPGLRRGEGRRRTKDGGGGGGGGVEMEKGGGEAERTGAELETYGEGRKERQREGVGGWVGGWGPPAVRRSMPWPR